MRCTSYRQHLVGGALTVGMPHDADDEADVQVVESGEHGVEVNGTSSAMLAARRSAQFSPPLQLSQNVSGSGRPFLH
jgi:hypothetical protein